MIETQPNPQPVIVDTGELLAAIEAATRQAWAARSRMLPLACDCGAEHLAACPHFWTPPACDCPACSP